MQAVILAAGEGRRMLPLTLETPKPLILVSGKTILERIIEVLPEEVTELILVVGYKAELIQDYFGEEYKGRKITYVPQDAPKGTYHALSLTKELLSGKFLLLNADDVHGPDAFIEAMKYPLALLAAHHENPTKFGVVSMNDDGTLKGIVEKPDSSEETLVSTGAMVLDERVFSYEVLPAPNGEFYLPEALRQLADEYPVQVVEQLVWIPIGNPEELAEAEKILKS
jgi:NDP-sugar pyrophosphorylase family protein